MGFRFGLQSLFLFMFMFTLTSIFQGRKSQARVFNVMNYGAVADGKTDNTKVFLKAWREACEWEGQGRARVVVPQGEFMVGPVEFVGPCKGSMSFRIGGVLKAPIEKSTMFGNKWIAFRYIDGLTLSGGARGTIDGQGKAAWPYNDCHRNTNCNPLPISMRFDFVKNSRVHHLRSVDSKNSHFMVFGCENLNLTHIRISAPGNSPNTDGIHVGSSNRIHISRAIIGTGDDCISLGPGSRNIRVTQVHCGPGHGISVGSLGRYPNEDDVTGVTVKNCTLRNTTNGLRIKTWASPLASRASRFWYEDIVIEGVQKPIIIDQLYCPYPPCNQETPSSVQISDITFKKIRGTSSSNNAVTLRCSKNFPCRNVVMQDINIAHDGPHGPAKATCSHVYGDSYGMQSPASCL